MPEPRREPFPSAVALLDWIRDNMDDYMIDSWRRSTAERVARLRGEAGIGTRKQPITDRAGADAVAAAILQLGRIITKEATDMAPDAEQCRGCGNGPREIKSFCRPCWSAKMTAANKLRNDRRASAKETPPLASGMAGAAFAFTVSAELRAFFALPEDVQQAVRVLARGGDHGN